MLLQKIEQEKLEKLARKVCSHYIIYLLASLLDLIINQLLKLRGRCTYHKFLSLCKHGFNCIFLGFNNKSIN